MNSVHPKAYATPSVTHEAEMQAKSLYFLMQQYPSRIRITQDQSKRKLFLICMTFVVPDYENENNPSSTSECILSAYPDLLLRQKSVRITLVFAG